MYLFWSTGMKFNRWNQNGVTWTCIVGGYCGFVCSCNFTNKGNPYTSEVEMQTKIMPSCKKKFCPGWPGSYEEALGVWIRDKYELLTGLIWRGPRGL